MPIVYFGTQFAAAPFYPGYSFSQQAASMLGTQFSRHPWIFNTGAMLTGITALFGAFGLYQSFRSRTHILLSSLIGLSIACTGITSFKAGVFPLPDPRHTSWGFLLIFMIITPLLMLIGVWKQSHSLGLRTYLILSNVLLLFLVPLMSRKISVPWLEGGTLQRLFAFAIFVPIGVVSFFFWRELHHQRD